MADAHSQLLGGRRAGYLTEQGPGRRQLRLDVQARRRRDQAVRLDRARRGIGVALAGALLGVVIAILTFVGRLRARASYG